MSKGRVQPVVRDLDMAAVIKLDNLGQNVVLVPPGGKGNWRNLHAEQHADTLKSSLDINRVLHSPQDGFMDIDYGGLTDDVAYAIWGDGAVFWMHGRKEQEEFFKLLKRETVMGKYPRPPDGVPVFDDLAAARSRPIKTPSQRKPFVHK
jgi:hypothetical protein